MKNVKFEVKGNNLIITCDLKASRAMSASGKSEVIASTEGNAPVENNVVPGLKVGLNVYVKRNGS